MSDDAAGAGAGVRVAHLHVRAVRPVRILRAAPARSPGSPRLLPHVRLDVRQVPEVLQDVPGNLHPHHRTGGEESARVAGDWRESAA